MKHKFEWSKLMILLFFGLTAYITIDSCYLMHQTGDLSPLSYLIPSIFALITAATSFYYNKAKAENQAKIRNQSLIDILKIRKKFGEDEVDRAEEEINKINDEFSFDEDDDDA